MIKVYLKQAWELLKQNKLFSMLYIVGTGLDSPIKVQCKRYII